MLSRFNSLFSTLISGAIFYAEARLLDVLLMVRMELPELIQSAAATLVRRHNDLGIDSVRFRMQKEMNQ